MDIIGELSAEDIRKHAKSQQPVKVIARSLNINRLNRNLQEIPTLKYLILDKNSFQQFPVSKIGEISKFQDESLSNQEEAGEERKCEYLLKVPDEVNSLKNLVELSCQGNSISKFPEDLSSLEQLKVLELRNNSIRALPQSVFGLVNLEFLGLGLNSISAIPDEIERLGNLRVLRLSDNELQFLPDSICNLKKLTCLTIRKNNLLYLPLNMDQLGGLLGTEEGFPRHSYHVEIMPEMTFYPQLLLAGNDSIMSPPPDACNSAKSVFDYLQQNREFCKQKIAEAKQLMI